MLYIENQSLFYMRELILNTVNPFIILLLRSLHGLEELIYNLLLLIYNYTDMGPNCLLNMFMPIVKCYSQPYSEKLFFAMNDNKCRLIAALGTDNK